MNKWFEIKNETNEIYIYNEIGGYGISAREFVDALPETADALTVRINSGGGSVFDGFAIYNALREHPANITIYVDGLAASIASVIAMAGDKVIMSSNAQMMIHDGFVEATGNAETLAKTVELLDRVSASIAGVYAARCGGTAEEWRAAMKNESWYSAEEAVQAGLADEIVKESKRSARNSADLTIYNYAGREFAPAPTMPAKAQRPIDANNESEASIEFNIDIDSLDAVLGKVD